MYKHMYNVQYMHVLSEVYNMCVYMYVCIYIYIYIYKEISAVSARGAETHIRCVANRLQVLHLFNANTYVLNIVHLNMSLVN